MTTARADALFCIAKVNQNAQTIREIKAFLAAGKFPNGTEIDATAEQVLKSTLTSVTEAQAEQMRIAEHYCFMAGMPISRGGPRKRPPPSKETRCPDLL